MNTAKVQQPETGPQILSDVDIDRVNGGAVSDIIDGVATVLGAILEHAITAPRDAASGLATGKRH